MTEVAVLELVLREDGDYEGVRKWAAKSIRSGDAFVKEGDRLFIIFPEVGSGELEYATNRLGPQVRELGADLMYRSRGQEELVDSVYRRADAQIIPTVIRPTE